VKFFRPALIVAILSGGVCCSAEAAGNVHHSADVRLDPVNRSVQVTDQVEIEAGGTLRFRLSPRLVLQPGLFEKANEVKDLQERTKPWGFY
jgi:hypothetical protein